MSPCAFGRIAGITSAVRRVIRRHSGAQASNHQAGLAHYLLIAPTLLLLGVVLALPALYVGWLSLNASTYGQASQFVGLKNYVRVITDPAFWRAAWNTVALVNCVVFGEITIGLGLAILVSGWLPAKAFVIAVIIAPYAITETTAIVMWRYMLDPDVGIITQLLVRVGLGEIDWPTNPLLGLAVAGLIAVWLNVPFTFVILYSALTTVPKDILEAAGIDGAGRVKRFVHVTLPIIMPAMLLAVLFRYIFALRMFSEIWLLTKGGPARMSELMAIYLYQEMFKYHEFGMASATGWCMLLIALLISFPYMLWIRHEVSRNA